MRIAVTGATGTQGGAVAHLLATHHPHWTVLGPAAFMGAEGPVVLPIPADLKLYIVAPEDIAAMAVLAFEQPERFHNRRIDLDLPALHAEFPEVGWHSYRTWLAAQAARPHE